MSRLFRFHHRWRVAAPAQPVYAALADIENYPHWWPQVRAVHRLDQERGSGTIRSVLPYRLHLVLTREVQDPSSGTLRVGITGDLLGWSQFVVCDDRAGTLADYRQEVVIGDPRLAAVAPGLSSLLRANHWWMMRCGERGLRAHLSRTH